MKIVKGSQHGRAGAVTAEDLALINGLARREMGEEDVYLFSVRLCDNEVDRDGERFAPETLEKLAELFVGKSGIFDHQWSAKGQSARIYKCEMVQEFDRTTKAGDGYCWLKGCAYMLRSEHTQPLIDEIEAGIKKEVSVGCSVAKKCCSICGTDWNQNSCVHKMGEIYDGKLCFASLEEAVDAYEFSFVAVPAQPAAGVVKGLNRGCADLKALVEHYPGCAGQLKKLEEEAALGRLYRKELEDEAVRLGLLSGMEWKAEQLRAMVSHLPDEQLKQMKEAYRHQAEKRYPLKPQLEYENKAEENRQRDGAFLI